MFYENCYRQIKDKQLMVVKLKENKNIKLNMKSGLTKHRTKYTRLSILDLTLY